jgi:hypothetical protein
VVHHFSPGLDGTRLIIASKKAQQYIFSMRVEAAFPHNHPLLLTLKGWMVSSQLPIAGLFSCFLHQIHPQSM